MDWGISSLNAEVEEYEILVEKKRKGQWTKDRLSTQPCWERLKRNDTHYTAHRFFPLSPGPNSTEVIQYAESMLRENFHLGY